MRGRQNDRTFRVLLWQLVVENDVQQRFVNPDAAVVFDEAEFAETIHEEADAGARGADHCGQGLLRDRRDQGLGLAGFPELGHQEQNASEALLTGVEELVDQVSLGAETLGEDELEEEIGEVVLFVQDANHLVAFDLQSGAGGHGGGRGHAESNWTGDGLFTDELARIEQGDRGFFPGFGDDGKFGAAGL